MNKTYKYYSKLNLLNQRKYYIANKCLCCKNNIYTTTKKENEYVLMLKISFVSYVIHNGAFFIYDCV